MLIYLKIFLSERIENVSSASTSQTIKRWNYLYAKGYLRICTAWKSVSSAIEFFESIVAYLSLKLILKNFFAKPEKRGYLASINLILLKWKKRFAIQTLVEGKVVNDAKQNRYEIWQYFLFFCVGWSVILPKIKLLSWNLSRYFFQIVNKCKVAWKLFCCKSMWTSSSQKLQIKSLPFWKVVNLDSCKSQRKV